VDLKEQLHTHLRHLVRARDPYLATAGHFFVQEYIREQLSEWGTVETDEFRVHGRTHQNLILHLETATNKHKPPILAPIMIPYREPLELMIMPQE